MIDKKLIFTVTAGRSGTKYLSKLFEGVDGVGSYHEPAPNYAQVMRLTQTQPNIGHNFVAKHKVPAILSDPHPVYVETSHLTCKGFLAPMLRLGLRPGLVFLRRHPRQVAWSFLLRQCVPVRSTYGVRDLLDPRDIGILAPFPGWEMASNYQLCFWYALEMECRIQHFLAVAQQLNLPHMDITHHELNDWDRFAQLLHCFDLPVTDGARQWHHQISAERHNQNDTHQDFPASMVEEEKLVTNAVAHFQPILQDLIDQRYQLS